MTWQDKASNRINQVLPSRHAVRLVELLRIMAPMNGSEAKFRRLAGATSEEAIWDIHAEIRFALIFLGLQFNVEFEPLGEEGPDLVISRDGYSAYVEVKRFRETSGGRGPDLSIVADEPLRQYGDPPKDIAKVRAALLKKFGQVEGGNGIVAFWSDNEELEDLEFAFAVMGVWEDLQRQLQKVPDSFLFSVFASGWIDIGRQRQIYCRFVRPTIEPFLNWAKDLDCSVVDHCVAAAVEVLTGGGNGRRLHEDG